MIIDSDKVLWTLPPNKSGKAIQYVFVKSK